MVPRVPQAESAALPRLRLADDEPPEHVLVDDVVGALAFLTDVPLSLSHPIQEDRFLPENDDERELLERHGTDQPYHETGVQPLRGPLAPRWTQPVSPRYSAVRPECGSMRTPSS